MATATAKPAKAAAPPAPAASPKPAGIRKLGALGAIASAPAEKKGKDYPLFPGDDDTTALVDQLLDNLEQLEALEGAAEIAKGELIARGLPHWFAVHHGKAEIASSVAFQGVSGREVLVTAQNRYKAVTDEAALAAAIGDEAAARYFRQKFELKIDGDKIPDTAADALITELQELFARHNASAALTAKATICPNAEFHAARHKEFNPEQNTELQKLCPIVAMVKTKGRGK
jgi:hypothetical protein